MNKTAWKSLGIASFGVIYATTSWTQTIEPNSKAAAASTAQTAAGGKPVLEEIVVTATRRRETLQNVPISVTAITSNTLSNAGVSQIRDLTQVAPGFFGGRTLSLNQPVIRGVGSNGLSIGDESNVATYVDGIYQGDPYSTTMDFVDIERVEVLRGPQGTVFGRNATGGLINVITRDPSFTTQGTLSARYGRMLGNANDYDLRSYITTPIAHDVAVNLSVLYRHNDGYAKDLLRGGYAGQETLATVRGKILLQPSEGSKIVLTVEYAKYDSEDTILQPYNGNTLGASKPGGLVPTDAWQTSVNLAPLLDYRRFGVNLRTSFDLGAVTLETAGGYLTAKDTQNADSDASNIFLAQTTGLIQPSVFSQEVRLLSNGDARLKWTSGLYYFNMQGALDFGIFSPTSTVLLQPLVSTNSYAGFAEGTYGLTDKLFLTLGGRFTREDRSIDQTFTNPGGVFKYSANKKFDNFSYRGILRYNLASNANVYFSYSTAFKSGVFNGTSATPFPVLVDPEKIKSFEAGLKMDPFSWLRTNLSAYRYNYTNMQVTGRDPSGSFLLQNAASAKIYGGEFEMTAAATDDLKLRFAAAYTHANFDSFPNAQVFTPIAGGGNIGGPFDVSGYQMPRAPRYTLNLGFDWGTDLASGRVNVTGNIFHSAKVIFDNKGNFFQKPATMANGEISWSTADSKLRFGLWAQNITNAKILQQATPGATGTYVIYQKPRRIGVSAEYLF